MTRFLIVAVLECLPVTAHAAMYLVNDSTHVITAYTAQTIPAPVKGSTWVKDATLHAAGAPHSIKPGSTWDGVTFRQPVTTRTPEQIAETRRRVVARHLLENWIPFVHVSLRDADMEKLTSQIEAMMRALLVDANVTTDSTYAVLLAEAQTSGGSFLRYAGDQWRGYYQTAGPWRLHTIHDAIRDGVAINGNTAGVAWPDVAGSADPSLNWPIELFKLTMP